MKNNTNSLKAKEYKENYQLANECVAEGVKLLRTGHLKNAEEMVRRGKNIFEELGEVNKAASSTNVLAIIYDEMGNDSLYMECMLDAIDMSLSIGAYDMASKVYNNLGSKFMYLKAYDKALEFFKMALSMFEKAIENGLATDIDSQAFVLILNLNISATYCYMDEFGKAKEYFAVAKEKSTHPYCERVFFSFQCYEGIMNWRIGEKETAGKLVDTIIAAVEQCDYSTDYLESVTQLLELLKDMKDYTRWKHVLDVIESRLKEDISIYDKLRKLELWLDFYLTTEDMEAYNRTCAQYYTMYREKEFHEYEKRSDMLSSMIELRASKKEKEETDRIVYLDPLTGIGNRNRLLADCEALISESAERKTPITIGLVDIDFFKECNDTYGHIAGDECLKKVAGVMKDTVGDRGSVYRYGGDEFLILITEMSENEVSLLGASIKEKLEKIKITNEKSQTAPYITVSQGYTQVYASNNDTIDKLVNSADSVLYAVKRGGRNNYRYARYIDIVGGRIG